MPRNSTAASLSVAFLVAGCAAPASISEKLARVGLERVSEEEALIPPAERGLFVPCRVLPGTRVTALPAHPAGYLIVGVNRERLPDGESILRAIQSWREREGLWLWVRRNPHLQLESRWWEGDVCRRPAEGVCCTDVRLPPGGCRL